MARKCVNAGNKVPDEINVIIQTAATYDPINYVVDKHSGAFFVESFHSTSMHYPCNYGYIPNTLNTQGSPISVLVITPIPVNQGCGLRCRPIGALALIDNMTVVHNIVAVPINKLTNQYEHIHKIEDLPHLLLQRIIHFFTHYKDLDQALPVRFERWLSSQEAKNNIINGMARFKQQQTVSMAY